MIHKILNWLIGSTWEERKEKERLAKWREERRKHWYSKITKEYWLENTGFEDPPYFIMFSLFTHKKMLRMNKRMEKYMNKIVYDAMIADVYTGKGDTHTNVE